MDRAKWFKVHSWVGFKLSILLCFILVTGTLATVSHELDWLSNPAKRVNPNSVDGMRWHTVYTAARQQLPEQHFLSLAAPLDPWFSAELVYLDQDGKRHRAFFHPSTGEYLGGGHWYNWQRFFRMSHRHLMLPNKIGITIVASLGILLLISLLTSMLMYRKWWTGFFRLPRTSHRKVFWADIHRLLGVWSMWFIAIISVTSIWYLLELWGLRAIYPDKGKALSAPAIEQKVLPSNDSFQAILQKVKSRYPELAIKLIVFPQKPGQAVQVQGQANAVLVRPRANLVSVDPVSAELLVLNKGEDLSLHVRISEAADPLHFGTFGGLATKILYFIFGIALSTLAITGTYIYGMRVARISRADNHPRTKAWQAAAKDMTWGKWLSYLAILACLGLTIYIFGGWLG